MEDKEADKQSNTIEETRCDDTLRELVIQLDKRMESVERQQASIKKKLDRLLDLMSGSDGGSNTTVKMEMEEDFVVGLTKHTNAYYSLNAGDAGLHSSCKFTIYHTDIHTL